MSDLCAKKRTAWSAQYVFGIAIVVALLFAVPTVADACTTGYTDATVSGDTVYAWTWADIDLYGQSEGEYGCEGFYWASVFSLVNLQSPTGRFADNWLSTYGYGVADVSLAIAEDYGTYTSEGYSDVVGCGGLCSEFVFTMAYAQADPPPAPPPTQIRLTLNAFIPYDHIDDPNPFFGNDRIFEGDRPGCLPTPCRNHLQDGSVRVSQLMYLFNPQAAPNFPVFTSPPADWVAESFQYEESTSLDGSGHLTDWARTERERVGASAAEGAPLMTSWGTAVQHGNGCTGLKNGTYGVHIHCETEVPNGVYPAWLNPDIEWDYEIDLVFGVSQLSYAYFGCRKWFPAYNIWIADRVVLEGDDSGNPFDILIPCTSAAYVERSGVISLP